MAPLEIAGIVAAVVLYLLFRAFNGPKLSDGRGREHRDEEPSTGEPEDQNIETKDSIQMSPAHLSQG